MDYVDVKYINLISGRLSKFKKIKNNLYNCRCPICGDSQKNKSKARGYFYQVKNNTNYKCHNCGINISLNNFLKKIDPVTQKQYNLEKFKEGHTGRNFVAEEPKFEFQPPSFKQKINLPKCSEVGIASEYLTNRKIDPTKFYYAEDFSAFVESFGLDYSLKKEPRIVIPLYYKKALIGFQGRALGPSKIKYITIIIEEGAPKIYGYDQLQDEKTIYVTEGPFDSTFIPNSIALCGADGDLGKWGISSVVWIYDNEPRNSEIVGRIGNVIDKGESVVIWPSSITEKDINDMVMSGLNVQDVIESNTYNGLQAKLKFNTWKRI